jgi:dTMP kinase
MSRAGLFVTFEGPEGSGKTTQIQLLGAWLRERAYDVLSTREPGGTRISNVIRDLVLDPANVEMQPEAEFLLFSAARAQLVAEIIRPHLLAGGVVLCDRYADSSLAYQGYGRGLSLASLCQITAFATGDLVPDLTVYLDLPTDDGLRRKQDGDAGEWNRMEREQRAFHERVRAGYLALAAAEPARWLVLDARQSVDDVAGQIRELVAARLGLPVSTRNSKG